jgi:hypothetical protein
MGGSGQGGLGTSGTDSSHGKPSSSVTRSFFLTFLPFFGVCYFIFSTNGFYGSGFLRLKKEKIASLF